jgi:hypothetical protein
VLDATSSSGSRHAGDRGDVGSSGCGGKLAAVVEAPRVQVQQVYYDWVPQVVSSDHRPVVAGFQLSLLAQRSAAGGADGPSQEPPLASRGSSCGDKAAAHSSFAMGVPRCCGACTMM